jgi:hypothetical protein
LSSGAVSSVPDTGHGIGQELQARIFEPAFIQKSEKQGFNGVQHYTFRINGIGAEPRRMNSPSRFSAQVLANRVLDAVGSKPYSVDAGVPYLRILFNRMGGISLEGT